jgi:O-antigen ligase
VLRYHTDLNIGAAPTKTLGADGKGIMHGTYVVDQIRDLNTGELVSVNRMCGTGIFNDPNDFALVLVTAIPLCIFFLTDPARKSLRPFWFVLLLLFAYALFLTSSRGGFLAMLAGLATLFHLRYGAMKSLLLGAVVLPVLLVVFAGRMTTFSPEEGTGMARIQLWNDGLFIFQQSPIIGVGVENFRQFSRHVAHNSFIHGYAEMGLLGGTLFVGAFYFALKGLYDLRQHQTPESENAPSIDPELHRLHPYLIAMLVAYTVGICFLSRNYIVPTYMMLGLALVYMRLRATLAEPAAAPAWSRFVWPQLAGVSGGVLIASFAFVRLFAK